MLAITFKWFMCAFFGCVPTETALHIWDLFLFEGNLLTSPRLLPSSFLSCFFVAVWVSSSLVIGDGNFP
jgi:hypothetical protein